MDVETIVASRDQTLIDECLGGRVDAFGELIEPYVDRLFNGLFRYCGNHDEASELLQESLIRAYRGLKSYQGGASFYTWLYRVALNVAFTNRRKPRLRTVSAEGHPEIGKLDFADEPEKTQPERHLEQQERQQIVQQALNDVPETYRIVLVLKDVEGMKYEEIAEILEVPVGTVRSRLHRGRSELRTRLLPLLEEGLL